MGKSLYDFGDEKILEKDEVKQQAEEKYDKYKSYSKSELEVEIEKEVKRQKASGTFDYNKLMKNVGMMKSYLTPAQYENMIELIEKLR